MSQDSQCELQGGSSENQDPYSPEIEMINWFNPEEGRKEGNTEQTRKIGST